MAKPIIVVAGWMRSGTSMMMRCLEAGGIPVAYSENNEDFELVGGDYKLHVTPELYEGMAVKSLRVGPERMYPWEGGYRIIFMDRDSREQQASWFERFGQMHTLETIEYQVRLSLAYARNRRDSEVLVVNYGAMVADPLHEMGEVQAFITRAFDFNRRRAIELVDPHLRHFDIEEMTGVTPLEPASAN